MGNAWRYREISDRLHSSQARIRVPSQKLQELYKETLELINERRRYKNARYQERKTQYKRLRNEVQ